MTGHHSNNELMSNDLGGSWSRLSLMAAAFGVFDDGGDSCYQIAHFSLSIEVPQKHLATKLAFDNRRYSKYCQVFPSHDDTV